MVQSGALWVNAGGASTGDIILATRCSANEGSGIAGGFFAAAAHVDRSHLYHQLWL